MAVDDPILSEDEFTLKLVPNTLVAEAGEGPEPARIVGYCYFQIMKDLAYVRHVVAAPEARRTGVGRALLGAVVELAREAGCTSWCLNVKPENTAARALYTSMGLVAAHTSKALKIAWSIVDASDRTDDDARVTARPIDPGDDERVETAMKLASGQLAGARAGGGRVLVALHEKDAVVGATIFDTKFPGAYPFRVARPELALLLLRAIRTCAEAQHDSVGVVVEGQPDVADALLAAGATLKLDILHMLGPLTAAAPRP